MGIYLVIGVVVALFEAKLVKEYFEGEYYAKLMKVFYKIPKIGKVIATISPAIFAFELVLIWPIIVMINIIGPIVARRVSIRKGKEIIAKCENLANNFINNLDKDIDEYNEIMNN